MGAEMRRVGTIKQIWRYPVKGMAGEQVSHCHLGPLGLAGDRIWAVRDVKRQEIQSCKFRPDLLRCIARCRNEPHDGPDDQVEIKFPDGRVIDSDHADIHQEVSKLIGHQSTLESLRPQHEMAFYKRYKKDDHTWLQELKATFDREQGEPLPDFDNMPQSAIDYVTLPGTFFLVTPFHMLTTATLSHMHHLNPEADWSVERFRPNIVIDTIPGMEGLVEQAWLNKTLVIGDAVVDCNDTAPRCGAVTRGQQTCKQDTSVLRTIVKQADQNLGVYGQIKECGTISIGDVVYLNE